MIFVIMMIMLDVDFQTTLLIIILIAMLFLPIPFVLKLASNTTWIDIDKEYISGLPVSSQVPRLMNLINSKNK